MKHLDLETMVQLILASKILSGHLQYCSEKLPCGPKSTVPEGQNFKTVGNYTTVDRIHQTVMRSKERCSTASTDTKSLL